MLFGTPGKVTDSENVRLPGGVVGLGHRVKLPGRVGSGHVDRSKVQIRFRLCVKAYESPATTPLNLCSLSLSLSFPPSGLASLTVIILDVHNSRIAVYTVLPEIGQVY